ncbi:MAG: hypothetical protein ACR5LD_02690 [Symbiopectobacterium sp.]
MQKEKKERTHMVKILPDTLNGIDVLHATQVVSRCIRYRRYSFYGYTSSKDVYAYFSYALA